MDQEVVVGPDIAGGREFITKMQAAGFPMEAAFWDFDQVVGRFDLTVVSSVMNTENPKQSYIKMLRTMDAVFAHPPVQETSITLLSPKAWLAKILRKHLKVEQTRPLNRTRIGDHFIGPGYLFFVN